MSYVFKKLGNFSGNYLSEFTISCLLSRIYPYPGNYKLINAASAKSSGDVEEVLHNLFVSKRVNFNKNLVNQRIKRFRDPIFLILKEEPGFDVPDKKLLAEINNHFPNITIIVDVGPRPLPEGSLPSNVQALFPSIDIAEEERQILIYEEIQYFLNEFYFESSDTKTTKTTASDPNSPDEILTMLATDKSEEFRMNVASIPNTPPEVLSQLAKDKSPWVRQIVAGNANTPVEILTIFAVDMIKDVRWAVADNPNTPLAVLDRLSKDEDMDVSSTAVAALSARKDSGNSNNGLI